MKMFLRTAAVLLLAAFMAFSCACGKKSERQESSGGNESEPTVYIDQRIGEPFDPAYDMGVVYDGAFYPVGASAEGLVSALGEGYEYSESVSCMRDGMEKVYEYDDIRIETVPTSRGDLVSLFVITGGDFETPRGIRVGSPEEEVFAAYDKYYFDEYYYIFSASNDPNNLSEQRIQVVIEDGKVTEINIFAPDFGS